MIFDSFLDLMDSVLLPQKRANPLHTRLDGQMKGGNRLGVGQFRYNGKVWVVHADTHYEPMVIAYEEIKRNHGYDPFVEKSTPHGTCLELKDELQERLPKPKIKHLYIYVKAE